MLPEEIADGYCECVPLANATPQTAENAFSRQIFCDRGHSGTLVISAEQVPNCLLCRNSPHVSKQLGWNRSRSRSPDSPHGLPCRAEPGLVGTTSVAATADVSLSSGFAIRSQLRQCREESSDSETPRSEPQWPICWAGMSEQYFPARLDRMTFPTVPGLPGITSSTGRNGRSRVSRPLTWWALRFATYNLSKRSSRGRQVTLRKFHGPATFRRRGR